MIVLFLLIVYRFPLALSKLESIFQLSYFSSNLLLFFLLLLLLSPTIFDLRYLRDPSCQTLPSDLDL